MTGSAQSALGAAFSSARLDALLRPRSVAFVGVSTSGGAGAKMLRSTRASQFSGPVWVVHPTAEGIDGAPCFKSIGALPGAPDCLIISVPAESVLAVLQDGADHGVASALVVSEGFADAANAEGRARQEELVAFAQRSGMAVAGPNCMGVAALAGGYAASLMDFPQRLPVGGVSLVSQSGGLANAVAELCANRGVGLNYLISIGNQAVVDLADYIDFLVQDPATRVIGVIMEGARDGRRFRKILERTAGTKPIVVLKLGRSSDGQAATLAHTGTLAGRHEAYEALFRQTGVASVESIDALVETVLLFDRAPRAKGRGVCMFTVSGGATSLIADLGDKAGLDFPTLSPKTNAALERILGVERQFGNPVDTVGMPRLLKDANIEPVLDALLADERIDVIGLVLGMRMNGAASHEDLVRRMAQRARTAEKPLVALSFISNSLTGKWRQFALEHRLPLLEDLERGLKAIGRLIAFSTFEPRQAPGAAADRSASAPHAQTLSEAASKKILAAEGFPVTREALAKDPAHARRLAATIDGAVAIKIQSPDIPHKSDIGGVVLGVCEPEAVEKAASRVIANARRAAPDAVIEGVLVQEMIGDGIEVIVGMTLDSQLGPLIVLGAGGVSVEIFKDVAVRLAPLTRADAVEMIGGLRVKTLLAGFRGAPPCDTEALIEFCVRFSEFVARTDGQFSAIDINPLMVRAQGEGVCIADAMIVTASQGGDGPCQSSGADWPAG